MPISLSQVEKLLAEVDALEAQQVDDLIAEALNSRTRLYERVASEVSRLKYFLAKGQHLPSLQQLQPRADSAVNRLSSLLRIALDAALKGGHQLAVLHCLQAYAAVGDASVAEQVRSDTIHCMAPWTLGQALKQLMLSKPSSIAKPTDAAACRCAF